MEQGTFQGGVDLVAEKVVSIKTIRGLTLTDKSLQDVNSFQYTIITYKTIFSAGSLTVKFTDSLTSIRTVPIIQTYYNQSFSNVSLTSMISNALINALGITVTYSSVTVGPPTIYIQSTGNTSIGTYTNSSVVSNTSLSTVTNDGPVTYSYTGTLPPGLSLNTSTGALTGTVSYTSQSSTTYTFNITATSNSSESVNSNFNITYNPSEPYFYQNSMLVHADGTPTTIVTGTFVGGISGTTLTINDKTSGWFGPGSILTGANILSNTYITAMGTGSYGSAGTYTVNQSQTVATTAITAQGAVNNSIINDLSPYNNPIQRNANHATGAFSPFSKPSGYWSTAFSTTGNSSSIQTPTAGGLIAGYSVSFNGSTQYLTIPNNAALQMGTGDFTIEAWVYQNNLTGVQTIFDKGYQTAGSLLIQAAPGSGLIMINTGTTQGYSAIFNGTSNFLATTANSLTTEDFTFECFFFLTSNLTYLNTGFYGARILTAIVTNGIEVWIRGTATSTVPTQIQINDGGATRILFQVFNLYIPIGAWNHLAITRNSSSWAMWLNGVRIGTYTNSQSFAAGALYIGGWAAATNFLGWFPGYISNLRIVKAVVYSPSLGNITVPTATLTNIANTYLLTCHAATFVDGSTANGGAAWTVTATGSTVATLPNPFMTFMEPALSSFNFINSGLWQHIAVSRSDVNLRVFRNGGQVGSTLTSATSFNSAVLVAVGAGLTSGTGTTPGAYFNGYISSFRILKGTALYTSNFFSPTRSFLANVTNTSLLICQASTITPDQSTAAFVVTNVGTATVSSSITPYLNGNHLVISTEDYTVEGFAMRNTISSNSVLLTMSLQAGTATFSFFRLQNGVNGLWGNGYQFLVNPGNPINDDRLFAFPGKWFHFAISRSSGQAYLHINGIQIATVYDSTPINLNNMYIGNNPAAGSLEWPGHISNFRVTKGSAIYAYNSTFTPPTSPLTAGTDTVLLACSSKYYLEDRSGRNVTLTRNNTVSTSPLSPFTAYTSGLDKVYDPIANSGSMSFQGSGFYIIVPDATQFNLATGIPWTVECWIWPSGDYSIYRTIFAKRVGQSGSCSYEGYLRITTGVMCFYNGSNYESSVTPQPHTWSHCAWVYDGSGNINMYLNGVKIYFSAITMYDVSATIIIGGISGAEYFQGYISNFRIVNGTAVYTNGNPVNNNAISFTPPTAPLTAITNTVLLITNTNNAAYDQSNCNNFYFYTGASGSTAGTDVSPAVSYLGPKSLRFNGTTDYICVGSAYNITGFNNPGLYFGTGDWTVEFWVYFNVTTGNQTLVDFRPSGTASTANYIVLQLISGVLNYYTATILAIAGPTLSATTWYHVSLSRQFNKTRLFVNGIQQGQEYNDTQTYTVGFEKPVFGADYTFTANLMNGYMDEIRMTRHSRYNGQFTIPVAAFGDNTTDDPNFLYNSLLIHGNGSNTQTNNTFVDTTANYTFTRTNTPGQGTFSPFSRAAGYWSNYFNGITDYLTVSNAGFSSTSLTLGSSNWTIEGWILDSNNIQSNPLIIGNYVTTAAYTTNAWGIYFNTSTYSGSFSITIYNTGFTLGSGTTYVNTGRWNHFAVVRNGNIISIYVNGNLANSSNFVSNMDGGVASRLYIGNAGGDATTLFNGYISNLRIVKSVAVYTGTFTPSTTPLAATQSSGTNIAAISGTSTLLLTCQNYNFIDNSTNAWSVIPVSSTSTQVIQPFTLSSSYSSGTNSGSLIFYGTPDYITSVTTQLLPSNGIFTLQCWIYPTKPFVNDQTIFSQGTSAAAGFELYIQASSNKLAVLFNNTIVPSTVIRINTWTHVAVTSSGSTVAFYINGVASGSSSLAVTPPNSAGVIGDDWNHTLYGFTGYISNLKIDTSVLSITLPTAPETTATRLLLLGINGGMIDNSAKNSISTVASTQVSTVNKKFGSGSMFFNGTTDYVLVGADGTISIPPTSALSLTSQFAIPTQVNVLTCRLSIIADSGTSTSVATYSALFNGTSQYLTIPNTGTNAAFTFTATFTVEGWFYPTNGNNCTLFCLGTEATGRYVWSLQEGIINPYISSNLYGAGSVNYTSSVPLNNWTHIAVVRTGSTINLYINGIVSTTSETQAGTIGNGVLKIGSDSGGSALFQGYISNLRAVKGVSVYTGTFATPTVLSRIQSAGTNITALTGAETSLLTLQNTTVIDNSIANTGVGFTIANTGSVTTLASTLYSGYAVTNTGTVTAGNSIIPFAGTFSYQFNGSTQNLFLPNFTPVQATPTTPFTIECWVYNTAFTGCAVASSLYGPSAIPYVIGFNNGTSDMGLAGAYPYFASYNGAAWNIMLNNPTVLCVINTWYHFAVSYDGVTLRVILNGRVINSTTTVSIPASTGGAGFYIGRRWDLAGANYFAGYISNFRFIRGSAIYVGGPTAVATSPVPYAGPFTIECWIYITSYSTMTIYSQFLSTHPNRFWFGIDNSTGYKLVFVHGTFGTTFGNTAIPLNQWNHVALVRDTSNRLLMFLNGIVDGSAGSFTNPLYQLAARIGNIQGNTNHFSGYIDDFKISLTAQYLTNFTVPTKFIDQ